MSTELFLPRIADGDLAAVRECIGRYGGLVWSLARRFLRNDADAEDAAQDIFVDLWKSAGRFNPLLSSESTFVSMVARRRLIDRRRRSGRSPGVSRLADDLAARVDAGADRLEVNEEAALVTTVLGELREDQQRVICLSVYDGMTHEEIAAATKLPIGTVKSHIRRGLIRIREILGGGAA